MQFRSLTYALIIVGCLLAVAAVTGQEPSDLDQVVTDSVFRNNYRDVSAFADLPEKPLWFFIDSLEQISQLADQSDPGKPQYRVSTNSTPIGLLAGFEVSRVDYSLVTQNRTPMPEMHRGALVLMNIWPGLYKLVAAYSGSDAPDSSAIVYLGDLECLGNFWYDDDRREIDWAQYWTWDWPTEAPKNLRFAQAASNALDSALPIGYYARYAGLMVNDSLSLTAPVYRPTDDFGKPTGGEVTIRFGVEENLLHVLSCVYRAPKK